eukprot:2651919-Alexandrium_andersonii.AAC.1
MSASLVGSEMCIRDRLWHAVHSTGRAWGADPEAWRYREERLEEERRWQRDLRARWPPPGTNRGGDAVCCRSWT